MSKRATVFHYDKLYKENYWFCLGWNVLAFQKYVEEEWDYVPVCDGDGLTINIKDGARTVQIIWTRRKGDYATLAHECTHAAKTLLTRRGIDIAEGDSEALCYYVEYLMNVALERF